MFLASQTLLKNDILIRVSYLSNAQRWILTSEIWDVYSLVECKERTQIFHNLEKSTSTSLITAIPLSSAIHYHRVFQNKAPSNDRQALHLLWHFKIDERFFANQTVKVTIHCVGVDEEDKGRHFEDYKKSLNHKRRRHCIFFIEIFRLSRFYKTLKKVVIVVIPLLYSIEVCWSVNEN